MIEEKALKLVEESLAEFESSKGSLNGAVQKLKRVAELMENQHVLAWCDSQLGSSEYKEIGEQYIKAWVEYQKDNDTEKLGEKLRAFKKLGFSFKDDAFLQELNAEISEKANTSSGGYETIGFIEEKYNDLVRTKRGNDDVYYKSNLNKHLNLIRAHGHKYASRIYKMLAFKDVPKTSFDYLKSAVDDRLLDLNPELAEQLMIVFKTVSGTSKEELSQSLTTCRRIIEKFADEVFPPKNELHKGRKVGKSHYINRLWAFIDIVVESESNKNLAQNHLEYLGKYIEATHKITNKGVHAELDRLEAIKLVFHLYLLFADLLDYLDNDISNKNKGKIDINKASIDELEAIGEISRTIAKELVKARVKFGKLNLKVIGSIKGVGPKSLKTIEDNFRI